MLIHGEENVKRVLKDFGLTETEAEVYLFLAKQGVLKGTEIARQIKKDKAQVYHILKSLQAKGLVELTIEAPVRFAPVPFEKVVESTINAKRKEATRIENAKEELLSYWKNISKTKPELPLEKFVVIEGRHKVYSKISQMIAETKNQLSTITTVTSLLEAEQFGLYDAAFNHPLKSEIQFRFLTELSSRNLNGLKTILKKISGKGFNFRGKNPDLGQSLFPRMVIRDHEETLFFITPRTSSSTEEHDYLCLWTNCRDLVQAFSGVFEDLWQNSTDIQKRITEIETGKPSPRTCVISDVETAHKKYHEVMCSAEKEVVMMTSSKGLIACWKGKGLVEEWTKRGGSVRIMAPITSENLEAAQQLLRCCEVRHVPVGYLGTTIVDGQHLFQFKNPPPEEEELLAMPYFENTFYTNDSEYVIKTKNMLDDIWRKVSAPSAITVKSVTPPSPTTIAPFPEGTLTVVIKKASGPTVLEEQRPLEKTTEKDILNKILTAQRIPAKDPSKEITRHYGTNAQAIIHPPASFNLPNMLFYIFHNHKNSAFGAEDAIFVNLWLKTPKGHAYVPVTYVGDNPEAAEFWRNYTFPGSPAAQNVRMVQKDELQIMVHGNTLFAGWTTPIPLLPSLILPPSCILLEGYGEVKTDTFTLLYPKGHRMRVEENGLEAFVTFLHPSSKYSGPGTDGFLGRECIIEYYPP
jgi:sugar-specific transcriptional regulator TrmB